MKQMNRREIKKKRKKKKKSQHIFRTQHKTNMTQYTPQAVATPHFLSPAKTFIKWGNDTRSSLRHHHPRLENKNKNQTNNNNKSNREGHAIQAAV